MRLFGKIDSAIDFGDDRAGLLTPPFNITQTKIGPAHRPTEFYGNSWETTVHDFNLGSSAKVLSTKHRVVIMSKNNTTPYLFYSVYLPLSSVGVRLGHTIYVINADSDDELILTVRPGDVSGGHLYAIQPETMGIAVYVGNGRWNVRQVDYTRGTPIAFS